MAFPLVEGKDGALQIIPRIPFCRNYILAHITAKSQHHIDDYRRTHREQCGKHKILTNLTGCNPHAVANGCTNPKSIPLHKVFKFVHDTKVKKILLMAYKNLFRLLIFVLSLQFRM